MFMHSYNHKRECTNRLLLYALHPTIAAPTKKSTVEHVPTTFDLMPVMMYVDTKLRIYYA